MFRLLMHPILVVTSFPHSRGDVPRLYLADGFHRVFSPLTWGCSEALGQVFESVAVFPTHVGMFQCMADLRMRRASFPHSRGDVPRSLLRGLHWVGFSPLTWGCS